MTRQTSRLCHDELSGFEFLLLTPSRLLHGSWDRQFQEVTRDGSITPT